MGTTTIATIVPVEMLLPSAQTQGKILVPNQEQSRKNFKHGYIWVLSDDLTTTRITKHGHMVLPFSRGEILSKSPKNG